MTYEYKYISNEEKNKIVMERLFNLEKILYQNTVDKETADIVNDIKSSNVLSAAIDQCLIQIDVLKEKISS